jgi:uncharacterized protein (UPF0303 family)
MVCKHVVSSLFNGYRGVRKNINTHGRRSVIRECTASRHLPGDGTHLAVKSAYVIGILFVSKGMRKRDDAERAVVICLIFLQLLNTTEIPEPPKRQYSINVYFDY